MAFGGPSRYSGKSIKEVHWQLRLTDMHFSIVTGYLLSTVRELGSDPASINEVTNLMESLKKDVVSVNTSLYERLGGEHSI